jgi:hypothetical protein
MGFSAKAEEVATTVQAMLYCFVRQRLKSKTAELAARFDPSLAEFVPGWSASTGEIP